MTFRPLSHNVLLERLDPETESPGGILLPMAIPEDQQQGKVLAVGPGLLDDDGVLRPMNVEVGQTVLFPKYGGHDVTIDGEERVLIAENLILGVIE